MKNYMTAQVNKQGRRDTGAKRRSKNSVRHLIVKSQQKKSNKSREVPTLKDPRTAALSNQPREIMKQRSKKTAGLQCTDQNSI